MTTKAEIGRIVAGLLFLAASLQQSYALDPSQAFSSYLQTHFTEKDGLPSPVVDDIVQSRDGFLWLIVNGNSLRRFDGRHFTHFDRPAHVVTMALAPDGDLWVGTRDGLERIPASTLSQFGDLPSILYRFGTPNGNRVSSLHFSRNGMLWVGTAEGLYRFEGGSFSPVIPRHAILRIEESSNGHLLVVTSEGFIEWDGERVVPHPEVAAQLGVKSSEIFHVLEDTRGVTWFCTANGVARRTGGSIQKLPPHSGKLQAAYRAYEDQHGNIWIAGAEGLFRATSANLVPAVAGMNARRIYGSQDGDLWIGTNGDGLYRFKDRAVRMFTTSDGLPNNLVMTVLTTSDGSLWTGANCGGVSRFDGQRFQTYNEKNGLLNSCVWALAEDANHDVWVGTYGGGAFRFRGGQFAQFSKPQGLPNDIVKGILAGRDQSLWFATHGGVARMRDGKIHLYGRAEGLSSNNVIGLYEDRTGGIWAGTSKGLDRLEGDRFVSFSSLPAAAVFPLGEDQSGSFYVTVISNNGIFGIDGRTAVHLVSQLEPIGMVETPQGELWLSGQGIFRVPPNALKQLRAHDEPLDYAAFGVADGLATTQPSIGHPNSAITRDGKLWIATNKGLAMLDLPNLPRTNRKPTIFMEGVTVGRNSQLPGQALVLPPGTHHVELQFGAVELSSPEKIRLQYRLDSVDSEWLDAGQPARATYSNIPLGRHSFHIRATNRDGIWDRVGMVYSITQQPYFYETGFFRLAAIVLLIGLLTAVYRLRMRRIAAAMGARFDERLAERTRMARELHDTLLQTVQGSKFVADHALERSGDPVVTHQALEQLSEWLGQAVQEGRAALNSLRTSTAERNDLSDAFRRATENTFVPGTMTVQLSVAGDPRDLHPVVRDEVYRIGYEAIRNACLHSSATQLDKGKKGHFGLQGMRERADRIGGEFTLATSGSGTEIKLIIPGDTISPTDAALRQRLFATMKNLLRPKPKRQDSQPD